MAVLSLTRKARHRAISLIEGVLYLVLAMAVIMGGIVFFQQATLSKEVNQAASMMTSISAQVISSIEISSSIDADSSVDVEDMSTWAIRAGAVPADRIDDVSASVPLIKSPWQGVITFVEAAALKSGVRIPVVAARMNDIPAGACMRLGGKAISGQTKVGNNVFAMVIEENDEVETSGAWTPGTALYTIGPGEETDFNQLSSVCSQDGRDLVVYYEINGIPGTIPSITMAAPSGSVPSGLPVVIPPVSGGPLPPIVIPTCPVNSDGIALCPPGP